MLAAAREVAIRKRIASIYNLRREDFDSLMAYNDYLEEVEDIVFDLLEGKNTELTEAKIAQYRMQNEDQIAANQAKQAEEEMAAVMQRNGEQTPTSKGIHDDRRSSHTPANGQAQQLFTAAPAYVVPGPDADPAALRAHLLLQLRAGGWSDAWAARRAIQEAHEALF